MGEGSWFTTPSPGAPATITPLFQHSCKVSLNYQHYQSWLLQTKTSHLLSERNEGYQSPSLPSRWFILSLLFNRRVLLSLSLKLAILTKHYLHSLLQWDKYLHEKHNKEQTINISLNQVLSYMYSMSHIDIYNVRNTEFETPALHVIVHEKLFY